LELTVLNPIKICKTDRTTLHTSYVIYRKKSHYSRAARKNGKF